MIGIALVFASILLAGRLGLDWRPAEGRLRIAAGLFAVSLGIGAIALWARAVEWSGFSLVLDAIGAFTLVRAAMQFQSSGDEGSPLPPP